ncbi:hypothetical protein BT96DRAFT_1009540 [Gymnopus androsaceus JB14]|uniref:Uncharacterized protein n=1 Tax=Gymnopus androsaceus JB14 TaxID=1447944 RepID=A0A6A4GCP5_9AGAR|nr:hypothetical protein BT96DRAFT_1009540 [Gymnopus androsaceus JB14]
MSNKRPAPGQLPLNFVPVKSTPKKVRIRHKPYTQYPAPRLEAEASHIWVGTEEGALLLPKLKAFDRNPEYGPNSGCSRLMRWERAVSLDLNPPAELGPYLVEIDKDLLHPWHGQAAINLVDKALLARWNASFLGFLGSPAHSSDDFTVPAWVISELCDILGLSEAVSFVHSAVHFDTDSLCVVERATTWLSYPVIPRQTDIVVSFKLFCAARAATEVVAYFLASLLRDFFNDGSHSVCIVNIAVVIDNGCSVGFVAFRNIRQDWFASVQTTPWFDIVCGWPEAFFSTWPLCDDDLGAPDQVEHTIVTARSLAAL